MIARAVFLSLLLASAASAADYQGLCTYDTNCDELRVYQLVDGKTFHAGGSLTCMVGENTLAFSTVVETDCEVYYVTAKIGPMESAPSNTASNPEGCNIPDSERPTNLKRGFTIRKIQ